MGLEYNILLMFNKLCIWGKCYYIYIERNKERDREKREKEMRNIVWVCVYIKIMI